MNLFFSSDITNNIQIREIQNKRCFCKFVCTLNFVQSCFVREASNQNILTVCIEKNILQANVTNIK